MYTVIILEIANIKIRDTQKLIMKFVWYPVLSLRKRVNLPEKENRMIKCIKYIEKEISPKNWNGFNENVVLRNFEFNNTIKRMDAPKMWHNNIE